MDAEEFNEIYRDYGNLVWSMIVKLGIPVSDREDIFLESWEAIFSAFDSFDGRSKLSTWIALVVVTDRDRHSQPPRIVLYYRPWSSVSIPQIAVALLRHRHSSSRGSCPLLRRPA